MNMPNQLLISLSTGSETNKYIRAFLLRIFQQHYIRLLFCATTPAVPQASWSPICNFFLLDLVLAFCYLLFLSQSQRPIVYLASCVFIANSSRTICLAASFAISIFFYFPSRYRVSIFLPPWHLLAFVGAARLLFNQPPQVWQPSSSFGCNVFLTALKLLAQSNRNFDDCILAVLETLELTRIGTC